MTAQRLYKGVVTTNPNIDRLEREIRASYAAFNKEVEEQLAQFVSRNGAIADYFALQNAYRPLVQNFASQMVNVMLLGTKLSAEDASAQLGRTLAFDATAYTATRTFLELRNRVIVTMMQQQAEALQEFKRAAESVVPIRSAKVVKEGLTLAGRQVSAIANFRRLLEEGSREALDRKLRDRRFDPTVETAIRLEKPLTAAQVDRMVERYAARQLAYRARTIAATEAVRIANEADHIFYQQVIESEDVEESQVRRKWVTSKDEKVRYSHRALNGVFTTIDKPWISGAGNMLRFPGDPRAPASDTINCRCWVATTLLKEVPLTNVGSFAN